MRNKKGITLIALVITIIVLLILAGVSLSLIAGENGILGRATKAVDKTEIAGGKEEAELLVSDFGAEFYEKKYVDGENGLTNVDNYIQAKFTQDQETTGGYMVAVTSEKEVKVSKNNKLVANGSLENGRIIWGELPIPPSENSLTRQVKAEHYGDRVNYSVTVNEVVLDDWKIFYNDTKDGVVSLIYGGYLPNSTNLASEAGLKQGTGEYETYGVGEESSDALKLTQKLSDKEAWKRLITPELQGKSAWAYGTPDLETGLRVGMHMKDMSR